MAQISNVSEQEKLNIIMISFHNDFDNAVRTVRDIQNEIEILKAAFAAVTAQAAAVTVLSPDFPRELASSTNEIINTSSSHQIFDANLFELLNTLAARQTSVASTKPVLSEKLPEISEYDDEEDKLND